MNNRFLSVVIFSCMFFFWSVQTGVGEELLTDDYDTPRQFNIGIVTDGPMIFRSGIVDLFKKEISRMAEGEFIVTFPDSMTVEADSTRRGVNIQIESLLNNPDCDLVVALGLIGSTEILKRKVLSKPVIAPLVFDAELQGAPGDAIGSGVPNLYYVDLGTPFDQELITFRKLVMFKRMALLLDERDVAGVPVLAKLASYLANEHSIKVELIPVGKSVTDVLERIPSDTEAVMVGILWQLTREDMKRLSSGLIDRRLPSFSLGTYDYIESGVMATSVQQNTVEQLARQVAINIQEIMLGEDAGTLPVAFSKRPKLSINMATARAIDVYPSLDYMTGANLINEERDDIGRKVTMQQVVTEALAANLDLAVAEREVAAGSHEVEESRSTLFPQISVGLGGRVIDEDRATYASGNAPEKAITGNVTASQQIYSEASWANFEVAKYSQSGREYLRDSVKLDIIFQATTAYLNVLRSQMIEKVQKDNMQLTQANLDRAQIRLSSGIAGPDEVYRWEAQFANDRQVVLQAESDTFDAMQALNRITNRPLVEEFVVEETDLNDPFMIGGDRLFSELIQRPNNFGKFREFAMEKGLEASPELKAIDAGIAAQERLIVKAGREYWLPTFSLEASVEELISESGAGERDGSGTGLDDTEWQVGVVARLPLFEGGRKGAAVARNRQVLLRLKTERRNTEEQISQSVLQAINNTRASYPSINLSRDRVDAARSNLKLVSDSYALGVKSIIELVDAQNQALRAELDAANVVYNFLIDLMGVQRSMGTFITFLAPEERTMWSNQLKEEFGMRQ